MQSCSDFEGCPFNNFALFGLVSYNDPCYFGVVGFSSVFPSIGPQKSPVKSRVKELEVFRFK